MRLKPLVFLIFVAGLVAYVLWAGIGSTAPVRAGHRAPEFVAKTLNGEEVSLADLKGRLVFLNFWRTDCGPCVGEMPDLESLARKFRGRKFEMMAVSLDYDAEDVSRFYQERDLTVPAFFDPHQKIARKYGITGTPETFVIDPEGKIAKYYLGAQPWTSPKMVAMFEEMIPNSTSRDSVDGSAAAQIHGTAHR